jgi:hypothetical protein
MLTKKEWLWAGLALLGYAIVASIVQGGGSGSGATANPLAALDSAAVGTLSTQDSLAADLSGNDTILDDFNAEVS